MLIQSKTACWKAKFLEYFSNSKHIVNVTTGRIQVWKYANETTTYIAAF